LVRQVPLEFREPRAIKDSQVHLVQDPKVLKVLKVLREPKVLRELRVLRVLRVTKV
jgi:hypothetical protein